MLLTKEHYDLCQMFESVYRIAGTMAKKEPKEMWPKGYIYCHGETNSLFVAFRHGYAYGKAEFQRISA